MRGKKEITRRSFFNKSSCGLGLGVAGLGSLSEEGSKNTGRRNTLLQREVWVASIKTGGLRKPKTGEDEIKPIMERMEEFVPFRPDIICLCELFLRGHITDYSEEKAEVVPGPIISRFGEFAKKYKCYIICPLYTKKEGHVFNSAVLIGRDGNVVGEYHKIHPTDGAIKTGTTPGPIKPPVFKTDFGKIGIQICFDAHWPEEWSSLKDSGAEIVFWPTMFNGGRILNSHAMLNNYYIVSNYGSTARVIDISGDELFRSGIHQSGLCIPVNLDKKAISGNDVSRKIKEIQKKYGRKIIVNTYRYEGFYTIESHSPDITVDQIMKEFELITYHSFIKRAGEYQDRKRIK